MNLRICFVAVLLVFSFTADSSAARESNYASVYGRRVGRHLSFVGFRLDGFDYAFDLLPGWAFRQVREWFPALKMLTPGSSRDQGNHGEPSTDAHKSDFDSTEQSAGEQEGDLSAHLSGNNVVINTATGSLNLVLVPKGKGSKGKSECTNEPPLGATCDEVMEFESCDLPVLTENNICDETCGRCQPSKSSSSPDSAEDNAAPDISQESEKGEEDTGKEGGNSTEGKGDTGSKKEGPGKDKSEVNSPDASGKCQTVQDILSSRSDLRSMNTLFKAMEQPMLRAVLGDSFVGTVFIPNESAFDRISNQIGLPKDQILAAESSFWSQVLDAHIVPGLPRRKFSEGQEFPTLTARWDIFVEKDDSGKILIASQAGFKASIVEQDVTACSSVVHIIDNVLLPIQKESAISAIAKESDRPSTGR